MIDLSSAELDLCLAISYIIYILYWLDKTASITSDTDQLSSTVLSMFRLVLRDHLHQNYLETIQTRQGDSNPFAIIIRPNLLLI